MRYLYACFYGHLPCLGRAYLLLLHRALFITQPATVLEQDTHLLVSNRTGNMTAQQNHWLCSRTSAVLALSSTCAPAC